MKAKAPIRLNYPALILITAASATSIHASGDYGPAIWNPACSSHWYTTGNGHKFHVVHDMEGYYLSTISYFKNCSTSASVHYCVNGKQDASSDAPAGEITQMVAESNYAWHVLCWNQYCTGTEHEGFASNPSWYTDALYRASAGVSAHEASKFGYPADRNHIVGHNEWQNAGWRAYAGPAFGINTTCNTHTDPGVYWDWSRYMSYIAPKSAKPAVFDPSTATFYLRNSNTTGDADYTFQYGNPGDTAVMGDWTGKGWYTPGVVRADANGTLWWYLRNSNGSGGADITLAFGNYGDIPVVGDWDGNGTFTPGVVRNVNGQLTWYLRNSNTSGAADITFVYGNPGDLPIAGDWDGNHTSTPGVFRPSTSYFYLRNSNSSGGADGSFSFGIGTDTPIAGDWNGDGYSTVGVVRSNVRYLSNSNITPTTDITCAFGDAGWQQLVWW